MKKIIGTLLLGVFILTSVSVHASEKEITNKKEKDDLKEVHVKKSSFVQVNLNSKNYFANKSFFGKKVAEVKAVPPRCSFSSDRREITTVYEVGGHWYKVITNFSGPDTFVFESYLGSGAEGEFNAAAACGELLGIE